MTNAERHVLLSTVCSSSSTNPSIALPLTSAWRWGSHSFCMRSPHQTGTTEVFCWSPVCRQLPASPGIPWGQTSSKTISATLSLICPPPPPHTHTHMHAHIHTHTHTIHSCAHIDHTHTHAHTLTHTCLWTQAHTNRQAHIYTHFRGYTAHSLKLNYVLCIYVYLFHKTPKISKLVCNGPLVCNVLYVHE